MIEDHYCNQYQYYNHENNIRCLLVQLTIETLTQDTQLEDVSRIKKVKGGREDEGKRRVERNM